MTLPREMWSVHALEAERLRLVRGLKELHRSRPAESWTKDDQREWDEKVRELDLIDVEIAEIRADGPIVEPIDQSPAEDIPAHERPFHWRSPAEDSREVRALRPDESCAAYLEGRGKLRDRHRYRGLTLGGYFGAMAGRPKSEVELRALAEGTDSAGGFTVPDILSAQLIDLMRAKSHVIRAGAQLVPLDSDSHSFAKVATDPTVTWRAENAAVTESEPTFAKVEFLPKVGAFLVKASREVLEDSLNLEQELPRLFGRVMAAELDRVTLLGSGSGSEPTGVRSMASATEVSMGVNGAALANYDEIVDLIQALEDANADPPATAIMAPRTWAELAKLKDQQDQPLQRPPGVDALTLLRSSKIPVDETQGTANNASTLYAGDWSQLWIGVRTETRVELLKERYMENLQYGFVVWMRLDIQAAHEEALGRLIGITP